jgi:RimJ/RimL family protein N-acetyltransferase
VTDIALRPIDIEDWRAVHEWASTMEACRYEAWGPNTVAETKAFVAQAVSEWQHQPQDRYVWTAEEQERVVGLGELRITSREWCQGDIGYITHVDHWNRGIGTAIAGTVLSFAFESMDLHRVGAPRSPKPRLCRRTQEGRHDVRGSIATHHEDARWLAGLRCLRHPC